MIWLSQLAHFWCTDPQPNVWGECTALTESSFWLSQPAHLSCKDLTRNFGVCAVRQQAVQASEGPDSHSAAAGSSLRLCGLAAGARQHWQTYFGNHAHGAGLCSRMGQMA